MSLLYQSITNCDVILRSYYYTVMLCSAYNTMVWCCATIILWAMPYEYLNMCIFQYLYWIVLLIRRNILILLCAGGVIPRDVLCVCSSGMIFAHRIICTRWCTINHIMLLRIKLLCRACALLVLCSSRSCCLFLVCMSLWFPMYAKSCMLLTVTYISYVFVYHASICLRYIIKHLMWRHRLFGCDLVYVYMCEF